MRRRVLVSFPPAVVLLASFAWAQSGRATIRGVVRDPSGATVSGVEVTATHHGTNAVVAAATDVAGLYSLLNLPIGGYRVAFAKSGFKPYAREGVTLGLGAVADVDVALEVGALTEAVTVSADASLLPAGNAELGTAMTNRVVTNLPLNMTGGRSLENFAYAVTPSVEGNNWESRIAGGTPFTKEVVIDGSSAVIQIGGHIGESSPPMDAVEEFRVQTSGVPAEYGRSGGGVFSFSLKSGGNELHGSVYGQLRNEVLNANTWQKNFLGATQPDRRDEYERSEDRQLVAGAAVGGPIFKDQTFFFASLEEYRQRRFVLGGFNQTVPIPAFLDGDFSALLDTSAPPLGYDPAGNPIYPGAILDPRNGRVFAGNRIPADRISRTAQRVVDIYRKSYRPMIGDRLTHNSALPLYGDPDFTQHQLSLKLDHGFSRTSRVSASFIFTQRPRTLLDQGGIWDPNDPEKLGGPLSKARRHDAGSRQLRLSHSLVVSPSAVHVAGFTFSRFTVPNRAGSADAHWPADLGFGEIGVGNFPQINFGDPVNGISTTNVGYGLNDGYKANNFILSDSLSWLKGRHSFKFGGELRYMTMSSYTAGPVLNFDFSNRQTGVPTAPWANRVGFGFASFLLGEVDKAKQGTDADLTGRRNYLALYAQDDFRLSPRLTLNLGLRWETTGPWTEKNGRWSNFDTRVVNPTLGIPGVLVFARDGKTSFEGKRDLLEFGPRLGLSYRAGSRAVIRAAYGMLYAPVGMNQWAGVPYGFAPGFRGKNEVAPTADGSPAFNWDNGYPGQFVAGTLDPNQTQWGMVSVNPNSLRAGRIQQWNAGVELEVARDLALGLNYLGNRGTRLASGDFERNQPDLPGLTRLVQSGREWTMVCDAATAAAVGVPYPYPSYCNFAFMATTPFPQVAETWGPLFFVGSPLGQSRYHGLQLTLAKRMSRGVAANLSYTLSRGRGNQDSGFQERWWTGPIQDVTRLDREKGVIANQDRTHVFKGYVAWDVPIGKGRRFLNRGGVLDALVGGWQLSALFRYDSGAPLSITSSNSYPGWSYPIYVNADPNGNFERQFDAKDFDAADPAAPGNRYFDPKAFSNPAHGEFGSGPGRFEQLRGFGRAQEDIGLMKSFPIGKSARLQMRFELINAFNRHTFSDPVTDIANPLFGQVVSTTGEPRQGQVGVRVEW